MIMMSYIIIMKMIMMSYNDNDDDYDVLYNYNEDDFDENCLDSSAGSAHTLSRGASNLFNIFDQLTKYKMFV